MTKSQQDPKLKVWVVYIAGDTLSHQPMGAGHMILLQLAGAYEVPHPAMKSTYHNILKNAKH